MRKALHLMGFLDDVDVQWMVKNGVKQYVTTGTVIIQEAESIDSVYVVLDGALAVRVAGREIASLFSGEIVGEMSFVSSRPANASIVALHDSHVLVIPCNLLRQKLANDDAFASRFYRALAGFLADRLSLTVGRFGYGSAQQDADPEELDDTSMNEIAVAANRFEDLLRACGG
jgi:CRP/FNR family transcriptional regulator, cyclic AMP receptor protein